VSKTASEKEQLKIDVSLEIAAPVEAVWKALTEARELERWFPPSARVTPGVGGEVFMSWGSPWEGGSRIEAWEEKQRLRTRGFFEHGEGSVVEYTLETTAGKTRLRLVHSGFASGTDWDDELYGGTVRGWRYELRSLRHYLERHRGRDRRTAWPKAKASGGAARVWERLMGRHGFTRSGEVGGLREGDRYAVEAATGDVLEGEVLVNDPPYEFAGTVTAWRDGIVCVRSYDVAGPEPAHGHAASVWLSAWELPEHEVAALGARWKKLLDGLELEA
jgi:uncharacterized protein YndB with AHSA1/START domain